MTSPQEVLYYLVIKDDQCLHLLNNHCMLTQSGWSGRVESVVTCWVWGTGQMSQACGWSTRQPPCWWPSSFFLYEAKSPGTEAPPLWAAASSSREAGGGWKSGGWSWRQRGWVRVSFYPLISCVFTGWKMKTGEVKVSRAVYFSLWKYQETDAGLSWPSEVIKKV